MERCILYVDPDRKAREKFEDTLSTYERFSVETVGSQEEALQLLAEKEFDTVVSEVSIGEDALVELFDVVKERFPTVPCIVFSDTSVDEMMDENLLQNTSAFIPKSREDDYNRLAEEISEAFQSQSEIDYRVPENEEKRVAAAEEIDVEGLKKYDAFQRLTKIAKAFYDVDYAFIGIVKGDEEDFITFEGAEVDEIPRECSICTFGILTDDTTVIDDRESDERLKYIDELEELDVKFYAGHPLITGSGERVGMFCVMDDETRRFSSEDRQYLKLFAQQAMELIRLYQGIE